MGTIDISYYNLFIGLLLLAIPFFYLWKFKTGLLKPAVIGTLRMIIQLFFIGIYLKYLFLWNNPWINFLWVIIMIFVAGQTALVRTQLKRSILLIPISIGFSGTIYKTGHHQVIQSFDCEYCSDGIGGSAGYDDRTNFGRKQSECGNQISDDDYGYYLHGFHAVTDDYYFTGFPKII